MEGATTYKTDFDEKPIEIQRIEPKPRRRPNAAFKGKTSYQDDFVKFVLRKDSEPIEFDPPRNRGKMEDETSYRRDYLEHRINPEDYRDKDPLPRISKSPFKGESVYKTDYIEKDLEPFDNNGNTGYSRSPGKFRDQTSYNADYIEHSISPRRRESRERIRTGPGKFRDETTYRVDYSPEKTGDRRREFEIEEPLNAPRDYGNSKKKRKEKPVNLQKSIKIEKEKMRYYNEKTPQGVKRRKRRSKSQKKA